MYQFTVRTCKTALYMNLWHGFIQALTLNNIDASQQIYLSSVYTSLRLYLSWLGERLGILARQKGVRMLWEKRLNELGTLTFAVFSRWVRKLYRLVWSIEVTRGCSTCFPTGKNFTRAMCALSDSYSVWIMHWKVENHTPFNQTNNFSPYQVPITSRVLEPVCKR